MTNDYGFTEEESEEIWYNLSRSFREAIYKGDAEITRCERSDYDPSDCVKMAHHLYNTMCQTRTIEQIVDELGWDQKRVEEALDGVDLVKAKYTNECGKRVTSGPVQVYFADAPDYDSTVIIIQPSPFLCQLEEGTKVWITWEERFLDGEGDDDT